MFTYYLCSLSPRPAVFDCVAAAPSVSCVLWRVFFALTSRSLAVTALYLDNPSHASICAQLDRFFATALSSRHTSVAANSTLAEKNVAAGADDEMRTPEGSPTHGASRFSVELLD